MHGCRQAAARWGHTSVLSEHESIGEFRQHAGDAWAGIRDFLLPNSLDPPSSSPVTHSYTDGKGGQIFKADSGIKRSCSDVWELHLSSSPYKCKTEVPSFPLRFTTENYTTAWSFAERLHTLATEQSKEWPQCRGVTSTGGQTTGSVYQQMSLIFWGGRFNGGILSHRKNFFNKLMKIPHSGRKKTI